MSEKIATRQAYGEALVELGRENPNIVVLEADLSKSTMSAHFRKEFPERFFNFGVAEANMDIADRGVLSNPIFLKATALVNVRPLRTHHWSGVGTCLKNYIQFVPDPPAYHDEGCSPLGKIWTYPIVKVGLHHTFRQGRTLYHVFSVTSKTLLFRLVLNTETLNWRLEEISDGLPD